MIVQFDLSCAVNRGLFCFVWLSCLHFAIMQLLLCNWSGFAIVGIGIADNICNQCTLMYCSATLSNSDEKKEREKMEINTLSCLLLFNLNLFANETTYSNTRISLTTIIHVAERTFRFVVFKVKNCLCAFFFWIWNAK